MTIKQSIANRKHRKADESAGIALYRLTGELLGPELVKLGDDGKQAFWRHMKALVDSRLEQIDVIARVQDGKTRLMEPPAGLGKTNKGRRFCTGQQSPDVERALATVEQICDLVDSGDIPEAGWEFAESIADRARSIGETIESKQFATENQIEALSNMLDALGRWID